MMDESQSFFVNSPRCASDAQHVIICAGCVDLSLVLVGVLEMCVGIIKNSRSAVTMRYPQGKQRLSFQKFERPPPKIHPKTPLQCIFSVGILFMTALIKTSTSRFCCSRYFYRASNWTTAEKISSCDREHNNVNALCFVRFLYSIRQPHSRQITISPGRNITSDPQSAKFTQVLKKLWSANTPELAFNLKFTYHRSCK